MTKMEKTENREIAAILNLLPKKSTPEQHNRDMPQKDTTKIDVYENRKIGIYFLYICSIFVAFHEIGMHR